MFWTNPEKGIVTVISFLSARDVAAITSVCKGSASISGRDDVWRSLWPWLPQSSDQLLADWPRLPADFSSWTEAQKAQALYRQPLIQPLDTALPYNHLLKDVTAPHCTAEYRAFGLSDGSIRIFSGDDPIHDRPQDFELNAGSIRHMQIVPSTAKCYAGSWNGSVHCICLKTGRVTPIVTGLDGPVYGLRVEVRKCAGKPTPAGPQNAEADCRNSAGGERGEPCTEAGHCRGSGRLFTCCRDGLISIWDIETGAAQGVLAGHTGAVTDFCVQRVWVPSQRPTHHRPASASTTSSSKSGASALSSFSRQQPSETVPAPSGAWRRRLVSCSNDGTIRVWDLETMECIGCLRGHRGPVWTIAAIGDCWFSGSADGTVRMWRTWTVPCPFKDKDTSSSAGNAAVQPSAAAAGVDGAGGAAAAAGGGAAEPAEAVDLAVTGTISGERVEARCTHVLRPCGSLLHRQVWCLKVVGARLFAGSSDGAVHCYEIPIPQQQHQQRNENLSQQHHPLQLRSSSTNSSSGTPPRGDPYHPFAGGFNGAPGEATGAPAPASTSNMPTPMDASAEDEASNSNGSANLLWSFTPGGAKGRDGTRRLDVVRDLLYTCSAHGNVGVYRMTRPDAAPAGSLWNSFAPSFAPLGSRANRHSQIIGAASAGAGVAPSPGTASPGYAGGSWRAAAGDYGFGSPAPMHAARAADLEQQHRAPVSVVDTESAPGSPMVGVLTHDAAGSASAVGDAASDGGGGQRASDDITAAASTAADSSATAATAATSQLTFALSLRTSTVAAGYVAAGTSVAAWAATAGAELEASASPRGVASPKSPSSPLGPKSASTGKLDPDRNSKQCRFSSNLQHHELIHGHLQPQQQYPVAAGSAVGHVDLAPVTVGSEVASTSNALIVAPGPVTAALCPWLPAKAARDSKPRSNSASAAVDAGDDGYWSFYGADGVKSPIRAGSGPCSNWPAAGAVVSQPPAQSLSQDGAS